MKARPMILVALLFAIAPLVLLYVQKELDLNAGSQPADIALVPQDGLDQDSPLDLFCEIYGGSAEEVSAEIRKEMGVQSGFIADGMLERANACASSAREMIEAARLCGGHTVEALRLSREDLVSVGMLGPIVSKGEKP